MTDRDSLEQIGKLRAQVKKLEAERAVVRNWALEEAANLCEDRAKNHGWNYYLPSVGRELAFYIRALKSEKN